MACDLQRLVNLPIREEYKMALLEHFQKPENAAACEELSQASDEEIVALISDMDQSIAGQQGPMTQGAPPGPGQPPPAQQGIGSMPQGQAPQPPQPQQARGPVPSPMDMPQAGAPGGINMLKPGGY